MSAPADLAAPADVFFSGTEKDPPFGILSCGFTAYGGVSGTYDETWGNRILRNLSNARTDVSCSVRPSAEGGTTSRTWAEELLASPTVGRRRCG
jgi:hypothetical protein